VIMPLIFPWEQDTPDEDMMARLMFSQPERLLRNVLAQDVAQ